jgi:hypothetical protein
MPLQLPNFATVNLTIFLKLKYYGSTTIIYQLS